MELFAGRAWLSLALNKAHLPVRSPYEAHPVGPDGRRKYVREHDLSVDEGQQGLLRDARRGKLGYVHLGVPCRTWGPAGRLAGGIRRGTEPLGDGSFERERLANLEFCFVVRLCAAVVLARGHFTLENPVSRDYPKAPVCPSVGTHRLEESRCR